MLAHLCIRCIKWYQRVNKDGALFRTDCNFIPSCSDYARLCLQRFGLIKGLRLGLERISRCKDREALEKKVDPVPEKL
ncbi:MAG: membrane protein insertion efficiency factor YidD [candidate division KSB1 bacterium]|nr:membrane protein insertion efficiency factor YidD [candidate division KSB1 bacterium]